MTLQYLHALQKRIDFLLVGLVALSNSAANSSLAGSPNMSSSTFTTFSPPENKTNTNSRGENSALTAILHENETKLKMALVLKPWVNSCKIYWIFGKLWES